MDDTILLRAEQITKVYPDGNVTALENVSLSIKAHEFVAIMGPSGSGKSTLLHILGSLDRPTSGRVFFKEQPLFKDLDRFRAEHIGFVFQSFYLLPTLTALENVQLPMFGVIQKASKRQEKAAFLLSCVHMSHRMDHLSSSLSVGERQRVAIARGLANDPELLFADEPTGNLDSRTAKEILDLFEELHQKQKTTLVIITHDPTVASRAERIISLSDGHIICH
jgi:ABC-type lipoprotein export system ATPase subunit